MRRPLAVLALIGLLSAACGDDATTTSTAAAGFPREIAGITLEAPPQRIISGSATHTEILFAVGAGDQVIAVDAFSDYPEAATTLPRVDAFNASVEGFAELEPDLVIVTFDPSDLVGGLGALGIPVWVLDSPQDLAGVYAQIEEIGVVTGHGATAEQLVADMESDIAEIVAGLPQPVRAATYYHELEPTLYSIGSDTFLGSLYSLLGLTSIADAAGGGYPQLSSEFIVDADPDYVFLGDAECCGESAVTVAARPGWGAMSAVTGGRVFVVDEDLASRWGPRVVDLLRLLAAAIYPGGEG
jgi:iron complex transport system substrate-binding protein